MPDFLKIPYMLFRGGTSKGPCFDWKYFPEDAYTRDQLLLKIMGSPHPIQIDGIGGGHDLANKICLVRPSTKKNVDIEYLLCQNHANSLNIETDIDCGNMLAAVAAFALEMNFVVIKSDETQLKIWSHNSHSIIEAILPTPNGKLNYFGNTSIDGVRGSAASLQLSFLNPSGSTLGHVLPTGHAIDTIENIPVSCVDISMPMVISAAEYFDISGYESKQELDSNIAFMQKLENIRKKAALKMGLGDVFQKTCPKICLISKPKQDGNISARYFIAPFENNCHPSFAITGAMCLAGSHFIAGTLCNNFFQVNEENHENDKSKNIIIEHPCGKIQVSVTLNSINKQIEKISYIRTTRLLSSGIVFISPEIETKER